MMMTLHAPSTSPKNTSFVVYNFKIEEYTTNSPTHFVNTLCLKLWKFGKANINIALNVQISFRCITSLFSQMQKYKL